MKELFEKLGINLFDKYINEHNLLKLTQEATLIDINSNARVLYFIQNTNYLRIRITHLNIITGWEVVDQRIVDNLLLKKRIVNQIDELIEDPQNFQRLVKIYQECL